MGYRLEVFQKLVFIYKHVELILKQSNKGDTALQYNKLYFK